MKTKPLASVASVILPLDSISEISPMSLTITLTD